MKLTVGQTLYSVADATTVIVVRAPADEVLIACGGEPMLDTAPPAPPAGTSAEGAAQLGKRYADEALGLELLCTKAGGGALELNGAPLPMKDAKPLPASD